MCRFVHALVNDQTEGVRLIPNLNQLERAYYQHNVKFMVEHEMSRKEMVRVLAALLNGIKKEQKNEIEKKKIRWLW